MYLTEFLHIGRAGLLVDLKSTVAPADHGLGNGNPWVVMTENTRIFLISRWIRSDLAQFQMISGVGRLEQDDTVFGVQSFLDRIQRFFGKTFLDADTGEWTEALCLDIDLSFLTFMGADLLPVGIIGTQEPFAIPAIL